MPLWRRAWSLAASRRLSVVLMVLLALGYVVWVLPFQFYGTPAWRTRNIASGWAFVALGVALALNTIACMVDRLPGVLRRCTSAPRLRPSRGGTPVTAPLPAEEATTLVARRLRGRRVEGGVSVVRGRFGPLGTEVFHLALTLLAVAIAVNATGFFRGKAVLAEGESFNGRDRAAYAEPARAELAAVPDALLPDADLTLLTVTPSFWRDVQLFTRLEARVSIGKAQRRELVAINRPAVFGDATVAVDGFGYAPELHVEAPDGRVGEQFLKLRVFPPGSVDEFDIPETPYRLRVAVYPDASLEGSGVVNRSYNLADPLILVRVEDPLQVQGTPPAFEGRLRPGETAEFFGYKLRFPSIRYYAELRVVRNPGAPWAVAGGLLALAGIVLRYAGRRREVLVTVEPDGDASILYVRTAAETWGRAHRRRSVERVTRAVGGAAAGESPGEDGESRA